MIKQTEGARRQLRSTCIVKHRIIHRINCNERVPGCRAINGISISRLLSPGSFHVSCLTCRGRGGALVFRRHRAKK